MYCPSVYLFLTESLLKNRYKPLFMASVASSSTVSIGSHSLVVSISGPPRDSHEPIVLVIPGAGDVASSYAAVERLVSPFASILLYDRSGLGRSDNGPNRHVAAVAARELNMLLISAEILPPLLLVGHSYGGIIAREYLHLYHADVAGLVLVDSATERQHHYFQVPDPNIDAVLGDLNYAKVTGLRDESKLSREEWRVRAAEINKGKMASQAEAAGFVEVCEVLAQKEQYKNQALGNKPLCVIRCNSARDYERIYEKGIESGNGTEQQRAGFRELINQWDKTSGELQEEQLQLSSDSCMVYVPESGHHVHIVQPEIVSEQIRLVRSKILANMQASMKL